MTRFSVMRLAKKLLEIHKGSASFDFELDTPDNARQLGMALESLGCTVSLSSYGARICVQLPDKGLALEHETQFIQDAPQIPARIA